MPTPQVFAPLWQDDARYKGAWGGRGSAKSHDRAAACVVEMLKGKRIVGVREVQRSIKDSVKLLIEDKANALGCADQFVFLRDEVKCTTSPGGMIFRGLQDHTAESIKSLEGYDIAWVEEAQTISSRSLTLLTPTIRAPGSQLWFTWNPRHDSDPVDRLLRGPEPPANAIVVRANFSDNPFFPEDLRADMERDKRIDPELYAHVWLGDYQRIGEGAYYARELAKAYADNRITSVPVEPNLPISTAWDIGVDDCTAIWVCQPAGREVHLIDYYQDRGYEAAHYARWVRDREYDSGWALLPHDAAAREAGSGRTYQQHLQDAGLARTTVLSRTNDVIGDIQGVRAFLRTCWFDQQRCQTGLKLLGQYRVEWDEKLNIPRPRPVKDGADHCADAFRALYAGERFLDTDASWDSPLQQGVRRGRRAAA